MQGKYKNPLKKRKKHNGNIQRQQELEENKWASNIEAEFTRAMKSSLPKDFAQDTKEQSELH